MIKIGDNLPDGTMKSFGANGPEDVDMKAFCKGKTVVLVSVSGPLPPLIEFFGGVFAFAYLVTKN